ncbi:MAG: DUF3187 family protein [Pseudomonadota bacterium]|nr:DUF3187 family protein [Pseudomonadota bacterium]
MPCNSLPRWTHLLVLTCLISAPAQAREALVFPSFNQSAIARFATLPTPSAGPGQLGPRITVDWTSESVIDVAGDETLLLDGEILRAGLHYGWQWSGLELGVEVPLLFAGGGLLDSGIESWHDTFGLPNGGREQLPRDDYRYVYERNGQTVFDIDGGDSTVGDLRLSAARCGDGGGCLRALLQLPVADEDELLGGGLGVAFWYEQAYALDSTQRWTGVIAAGLSAQRAIGPLESLQREVVPFGWASIGYAVTDRVDAGLQFYAHAPLYDDSELEPFSNAGGQLSFGFAYRPRSGSVWRLSVVEDLITESSPDFVIHFSVDLGRTAQ